MTNRTQLIRHLKIFATYGTFWLILCVFYVASGRVESTSETLLALALVGLTASLILNSLLRIGGGIGIDILRPLSLYSGFYFLYYVLPFLLLFYSELIPSENELTIAFLLLVGYIGCALGVKASRAQTGPKPPSQWIRKNDALSLLILCVIAICLISYAYVWRDEAGIFYNQARYYEQDLTTAGSLRDAFGMSLQLPVLLFLGLLGGVPYTRIGLYSRWLFRTYALCMFVLMILSSQTRLAITVLVFFVIAAKMGNESFILKSRHLVALCSVGITALLLIQGVRVAAGDEFSTRDSQFQYAVKNTVSLGYTGVNTASDDISQRVTHRSGANVMFLSQIMNAADGEFLYGKGIVQTAPVIVPRFLWPDKPSMVSPQVEYESLLGLDLQDAPLTPVNQFYAEGGAVGVFAGYFIFGFLLGKLSNLVSNTRRTLILICFLFVWSSIVQIENEVIVGTALIIRNALFAYIAFLILSATCNTLGRKQQGPTLASLDTKLQRAR